MLFRSRPLWQAMGIAASTVLKPGQQFLCPGEWKMLVGRNKWRWDRLMSLVLSRFGVLGGSCAAVGTALPSGMGKAASRSPSCSLLCTGRAFFSSFQV